MALRNERGEGRLSTIIWLIVLVAVCYALWNVVPVYIANFSLKDKMNEIARSPRGSTTDDQLRDILWKEVRERRLDAYIERGCFHISTVETNRRITCTYDRTEQVLPGFKWTFRFNNEVEQPLIF